MIAQDHVQFSWVVRIGSGRSRSEFVMGNFFDVPYRHVGILPHECIQEKVLAKGFLHQRKILTQYLVGTLHATHFYWRESCRLI